MALLSPKKLKRTATARVAAILLIALAACALVRPSLAVEPQDEYAIKAAFLLNFGRLVEWPEDADPARSGVVVIGVFGEGPAYEGIREGVREMTVRGLSVATRRVRTLAELRGCHMLFVTAHAGLLESEMLRQSQRERVLTIGESPGFTKRGGIINFFTQNQKTRFEVNRSAAEAAQLRLSSRLLRLAKASDAHD